MLGLERLSIGVEGYTIDQVDGSVWVPMMVGDEPVNVARFLESLSLDTVWVFPSPAPEHVSLLEERGFYRTEVFVPPVEDEYWDPELWDDDDDAGGEVIVAWVRDRRGIVDVVTDLV